MTEQLGDYELVRHLATGGMAEIFIARQSDPTGSDRELAIKRILPHLAREERFISMFLDEARIAARLRHPNIVRIYELGEEAGEYFIAMEYIEGGDLADLLDRAEQRSIEIPIAMSIRIIADVLAALDYAHEYAENGKPMRIVHRDVSPHNVLIGRDGVIKLVDFGIAHAVERHAKTETGLVKGKLSYMSPEQIEQHGVDRRADIFSAGALLYELLTGNPPFGRELAAVNAILHEDPPSPQLLRPDIPDELVEVTLRALEKDPDVRYQRAQDMLEALEDVLRVFAKTVSPKQLARFSHALMTGGDIDGFDDVSQAIPRAISREAMLRAAYAVGTPIPLQSNPDATEIDPPRAIRIPIDEDAPTEPRLGDVIAAALPVRSNLYDESGDAPRPMTKWFTAAAVGLLGIGAAAAVFSGGPAQSAQPNLPAHPVAEPIAATTNNELAVIELDPQYVDDADYWEDEQGFTFGEAELELNQLEQWVDGLGPRELDQMLEANFGREDGDYLWSVRGALLARQLMGPPARVNPGDPRAPKLLGLEGLDDTVLKPRPRKKSRPKKQVRTPKPRTATASATPTQTQTTTPEVTPPAAQKRPEPTAAKATPKAKPKPKKKKKNDLRMIDTVVPY